MTAFTNFSYATVATAPSPATSGTSLTLTTGQGAYFPTQFPFNCTVWPAGVQPLETNAEIVTVTGISGDTLTITRGAEGTTPVSIAVGYQLAATITAQYLNATQVPLSIPAGTIWPVLSNVQTSFAYPISVAAGAAIQVQSGGLLINMTGG